VRPILVRALSIVNIHLIRAGAAFRCPGADSDWGPLASTNPTVEALAAEHANFDLDHVQPAGVLGDVMKF
jgi:hypothetical protein